MSYKNIVLSSTRSLTNIPAAQQNRLACIDFHLQFLGKISRNTLIEQFRITPSMVIRDFSAYRKLMPDNMLYDSQQRCHIRQTQYQPLFHFDVLAALSLLKTERQPFIASLPERFIPPDQTIVSALSRAISLKCPVKADYISLSQGQSQRIIMPHSLIDNGARWHVRAFDRQSQAFRDFVLTRFQKITLLPKERKKPFEMEKADVQWQSLITLTLKPHPKLAHPQSLKADYHMPDEGLHITIRAALAGYLLRQWRVDCSDEYRLNPNEYQLSLANRDELFSVESLNIAPGYQCCP